jgi:hypothetical protein
MESKDDFKWFGEGFSGFPKKLPDDTVEYAVFMIDSKLAETQITARLRTVLQDTIAFAKDLLKGYIWQRDGFSLELKKHDGLWALRGRTNYGDSVADEWLIVHILRELSKKQPDTWIRVYDSDGEFLLIEAANTLPRWLKPEISENRIWIHQNKLRIIPLKASTPLATKAPSLQEAVSFINANGAELLHSPLIESEAFYRLRNYPKAIAEQFHHSLVRIPRSLASVLHRNPTYISSAIEAFYLRDPIALKPLQTLRPDQLHFPPKDFVTTSVKFTKVGYAQLKSQEFPLPESWNEAVVELSSAKDVARAESGMKLTCGFEMLVSDPQTQDKKSVREIQIILEDIANGEEELPGDSELSIWSQQDDDESWMDINFKDFEAELAGKESKSKAADDGFGDKAAQEQLRKMVSRFEDFMNDDEAGVQGAERRAVDGDSDTDDSDDDEGFDSGEEEDKDVSFDENEFARMMREMMGLPPEVEATTGRGDQQRSIVRAKLQRETENDSEDEEIHRVMERMEAELQESGVLDLDPTPKKIAAANFKGKGKEVAVVEGSNSETEEESGEMNIDFTLAKNLLESFKSQAGAAGPAGNLMGLLGVQLPPDKPEK